MSGWTRDELCQWVEGKQIYARDISAATVAAPEWLLAVSEGIGPNDDSAKAMESTHPEDRQILIATFIEALGKPGTVVRGRLRADRGDEWVSTAIEWLNLLDHPDVGCLICTIAEIEADSFAAPLIGETGDHHTTKWMVLDLYESGVIRSVDGKVRETIGYEPEELVNKRVSDFLHRDSLADGVANWVELRKMAGATSTSRRPWTRKHGGYIWLEASYLNRGEDSIMAVVWDITEKRKQEQELADITAQFQILADEVPAAVFRCDTDGTVLFHNARWSQLIDDHAGDTRLHDLVSGADAVRLTETLAALAADGSSERRTVDLDSRDGSIVWRLTLRPTGDFGAGRITVVGSIEDVTATVRLHAEIRHDTLTGVLNRHGLDERLEQMLAEDPDTTLVAFIDLDGFKPVNDQYGHDAGDVVLIEVARRLGEILRPGDAVGRYGGDEFVVVCRGIPRGEDAKIARRIDEAISGTVSVPGGEWQASASVGTTRLSSSGDLAAVMRAADQAMFEAKRERKKALGIESRR
jgi:diguanylate cyclase (GGDEF)-like protein/PAS domain S-box-containing protein